MLFLVTCHDRPGGSALRSELMPRHQAYIEPRLPRFKVGGFTLSPSGEITGSAAVVEAENKADALAIFEGDPYFSSVWERVDCTAFDPRAGDWIGGKTW